MAELPNPNFDHPYYFLWHLVAIGVIQIDEKLGMHGGVDGKDGCPAIIGTVWDQLNTAATTAAQSRVAMIDVGCSRDHPNLLGRVNDELSIDLAAHPFGAKFLEPETAGAQEKSTAFFKGLVDNPPPLNALATDEQAYLAEFVEALTESNGVVRQFGDIEEKFSSHGTAVAGLIVGGPAPEEQSEGQILPYFGVDPFSEVISIRTSFDNNPEQMLAALLYAWMHRADAIVLPRGFPDPVNSRVDPKGDLQATLEAWKSRERNDLLERKKQLEMLADDHDPSAPDFGKSNAKLWAVTEKLLLEISKTIPVICAAGNEGESQMLYPARLAERENGIIAVGAVTSDGLRAGYSNYGDELTVVAPSDDMEIHNRHQVRTNWQEYEARKDRFPIPEGAMKLPYSTLALLTTDLPGSFGYEGEDLAGYRFRDLEAASARNGYYTAFGGTSGACAQVAGVVALVRRAERIVASSEGLRDGPDIKALLQDTARKSGPVLPGGPNMVGDNMNAPDEDAHPLDYFFGGGLVDARAAVAAVLEAQSV